MSLSAIAVDVAVVDRCDIQSAQPLCLFDAFGKIYLDPKMFLQRDIRILHENTLPNHFFRMNNSHTEMHPVFKGCKFYSMKDFPALKLHSALQPVEELKREEKQAKKHVRCKT